MTKLRILGNILPLVFMVILGACSAPPEHRPDEVSRLAQGIMSLSAEIDPNEAQRAAWIAINYPKQLKAEYGVTDPPLIHNIKVNSGKRPRGLCWHWAQDMQVRLAREEFQTLELHRAIANGHSRIIIDHSTVIISARGTDMFEGMILDPWRYGGVLFWSPVRDDKRYTWVPRQKVFEMKRARRGLAPVSEPRDPSTEPLPEEL